ncbi:Protein-tyrosine phosphatase [Cooperia oncophora]
MTEFVEQLAYGRNRYRDVGCFDDNRVILTLGHTTYIHANYVSTPSHPRKFVCTQFLLPSHLSLHTCAEFWCMVVQEEADVILMLCNFTEMGREKCAEYYPTDSNEPLTFEGNITVSFKNREQFNFPFETNVVVEVTSLEVSVPGCPHHSCAHYHWVDWPDRGVPQADLAPLYLLHELVNTRLVKKIISKSISASSLIPGHPSLYTAQQVLAELDQLSCSNMPWKMTAVIFVCPSSAFENFLHKTGCLPQSLDLALETFKKNYHKITKGF